MTKPRRTPMPPAQPRQINIAFESTRLLGLSTAERRKVLTRLAHLLMLAAGVVLKENDDER